MVAQANDILNNVEDLVSFRAVLAREPPQRRRVPFVFVLPPVLILGTGSGTYAQAQPRHGGAFSWCQDVPRTDRKISTTQQLQPVAGSAYSLVRPLPLTAPAEGIVLDAPPVLVASDHSVDYTRGRCSTVLLHTEEGQVRGFLIRCTKCGRCPRHCPCGSGNLLHERLRAPCRD
jgi:hypothetical protein